MSASSPVERREGLEASMRLMRGYRLAEERRNIAPTTIDRRRRTLWSFADHVDPLTLLDVDREVIEGWLDTRRLGPRSRYTYLSTLTMFYEWAVDAGHLEVNPTARIPRPRLPELVPRPIAEDDLMFALRGADPRMTAWLSLAAYMGLRCHEIARVRSEDVLLDRDPPMLIVSQPKGRRQRILPLHPAVEAALRAHGLPMRGYLFETDGRPVRPGTVSTYIGRHLQDLGIRASAHQLRHLFGTALYASTKDIVLTQTMLGHRSAKTTAIYVAFDPGDAVDAMRGLTFGPPPAGSNGGSP